MTRHGSASPRKQKSIVIDANLKRRARLLVNNRSLLGQARNMILYALEIKDPYLPQLVRRVEAGEWPINHLEKIDTPHGKQPAP